MTKVKRVRGAKPLEVFLNKIKPDDPNPQVLVDNLNADDDDHTPQYTVIWFAE
jgi:hypothetical protein